MALITGLQRSRLASGLAHFIFKLTGWRTHVISPLASSYVLIGAPHTSNWDFILVLFMMIVEGIPVRWMGKDSLFWGPLGVFMRSVGVFPVNRSESTNMVDQVAARFSEVENLVIGLAPEGTRGKTTRWRTGFYYIALKARVPIVMAYIDYRDKIVGIGPSLNPTGDLGAEFEQIRTFYSGITGKYPQKQGEIRIDLE